MRLSEFYTYTNCGYTPCTGTLNHDGETVVITAFISAENNFPTENRFHVYETSSEVGPRLEIHTISDGPKIFDAISKHLSSLSNPDKEICKSIHSRESNWYSFAYKWFLPYGSIY